MRVARAGRHPVGVDFLDRVGPAVDHHVQPRAEQVLVPGGAQAGRDLGGVRRVRGVVTRVGGGEQDAGELDLALDRAVQVEVPVEAVVVVADGAEEGDHQAALAAGLGRPVEDVGVLPEDAEILLVNADGVADRARLAVIVGDGRIQVGDLAQAVTAQLQGVRPLADQVLAAVEVVLPVPGRGRIAVGHDHLRDGRPVDHRPPPALVIEADLVQRQPLAGIETDPQ